MHIKQNSVINLHNYFNSAVTKVEHNCQTLWQYGIVWLQTCWWCIIIIYYNKATVLCTWQSYANFMHSSALCIVTYNAIKIYAEEQMQWLTGSQIPTRENNIIILLNGTYAFYKYNWRPWDILQFIILVLQATPTHNNNNNPPAHITVEETIQP